MRYLFVIFLIALLPLRGWAGHVMAIDMAGQQIIAAQGTAKNQAANATISAMPADCQMLTQGGADAATSSGHCSCDTCELCLALACAKEAGFFESTFTPSTPPQAAIAGFVSADRSTGLKPPIS